MAIRDWNPFAAAKRPDSPVVTSALADLARLGANRPELSDASGSLGKILRAAFSEPIAEVAFEVDPELIISAWRSGISAFRVGEAPPAFDPADIKARGLSVLEAIRGDNRSAKAMITRVIDGSLDLSCWANEAVSDQAFNVDNRAQALGIDAAPARSVLRLVVLPGLERLSRKLATLRAEASWTRGDCPNCGSPPVLAESRGLEQRRHWRCGLCAADWEGERLRCPFCDETDHRKLSFIAAEGEQDRYRVSLCESCGGRLKVVATLGPLTAPGLLVAELATSHLDEVSAYSV